MAKMVSFRVQRSTQSKGQAGHDFNHRPAYAIPERKHLNKTLFGGSEEDVKSRIAAQSESVISRYNSNADAKRALASTPQEKKKIGSWRKNTATHKKAIITFSREVTTDKDSLNRDELDQCAFNFFDKFCTENKCDLTYIVRHDDETSPHYHAMFTNLNQDELKPLRFEMKDLSLLQDDVGQAFTSMGMERGVKRNTRLDLARKNNPQLLGEDDKAYSVRIYKVANVMHRPVNKMHEDIMPELLAKKEDLEDVDNYLQELLHNSECLEQELGLINSEIEQQNAKSIKNALLIKQSERKLEELNDKDVFVESKIMKKISIYHKREAAAIAQEKMLLDQSISLKSQISGYESKISQLTDKVISIKNDGQKYVKIREQKIAQMANIGPHTYLEKINALEEENTMLKNKYEPHIKPSSQEEIDDSPKMRF